MSWSHRDDMGECQYESERSKLEESFTDEVIYKIIKDIPDITKHAESWYRKKGGRLPKKKSTVLWRLCDYIADCCKDKAKSLLSDCEDTHREYSVTSLSEFVFIRKEKMTFLEAREREILDLTNRVVREMYRDYLNSDYYKYYG